VVPRLEEVPYMPFDQMDGLVALCLRAVPV
jgi:hypothetical protein